VTTTKTLGQMLMTSYLLPFEIASIVLLVALIGAAMYARRTRKA
jgi:NADH-quinone oxidoreductase subunit J